MKAIKDFVSLEGQIETITATDFRKEPGNVLEQVSLGKTFRITKNGKMIAQIQPAELTALEIGAEVRRLGLVR